MRNAAIFFACCLDGSTYMPATMSSLPLLRWYEFGIVKAAPDAAEAAPWVIYIQASTPRVDFENQWVPQQALRNASNYFIENGKITYEHINDENRHDASVIIGEPMAVEFPSDGSTVVQARLYPLQPQAQFVWNILRSAGKLKASIGGACQTRPSHNGTSEVAKIFWNHLAITSWPMNDDTRVSLEPFSAFVKALGVASAAPLVMQDLEGSAERQTPAFAQRWQALTELLQQRQPGLSAAKARQIALLLLIRRGEARHAFVTLPSA